MTLRRSLNEVLDECLQRVLADGESIDACVALYPEYADEIRGELEVALAFRGAFEFTPDAGKKREARLRMHDSMARRASRRFAFGFPWPKGLFATGTRIAVAAAVGVLALVGSGTGTVLASQNSAPGDLLYTVKRASEDVRLAFALSDNREADLLDRFVERRVQELDAVTAAGREQHVSGLVKDIIRKSERAQRLVAAPVRQIVETLPAENGATAGRTPELASGDSPSRGDRQVSAGRVLALNEDLGQLDRRLQAIAEKVAQRQSLDELKKLRQALAQTKQRLETLLDRADQVHQADWPADADDPGATAVGPPRDERDAAQQPGGTGRVEGTVRDVLFQQKDGRLVRVDVEVLLEDGDVVIVIVERGGARLLKEGQAAGIRQLRIGQRVTLGVTLATGEVHAINIVSPPEVQGRGTGIVRPQGRRQGTSPPEVQREGSTARAH